MKNIFSKVRISPFFLFMIFLSFISGLFRDILSLILVLFIHELGHIIISILLKWKINKIDITICGGFITYNDIIDKPFKEELLIALAGFMFQFFLYLTTYILFKINIIDNKDIFLINKYNLAVFLFNLIPIYPLDGSKIIMVLLNIYMPYKKSLSVLNIISIIILIILTLVIINIKLEYSYIIIILFISSKIIKHIKDEPYLFNKLLFERYIYPINTNKYNYIDGNNIKHFMRRKKNFFRIYNHYVTEKEVLSKKFD